MNFKIKKDLLLNGIQKVQNVVTGKSVLPILSNILLEAQEDRIKLTATDLDIGISCVVPVNTQESGVITIPAKRFSDIIKELPGSEVSIVTKKNNLMLIETESCRFRIMGTGVEDFPKLPGFKDKEAIKLDQADLKHMLHLTSFAVSFDESRYVLNGILFQISKNTLLLVATDGKRLAVAEKKLKQNINKDIQMIVPIKAIQELTRSLQDEGELGLVLGNNQVLFELDGVVIISRLIEGEFPDYHQVIPPLNDNKIRVSREEFLLAVKRAALLSTPDYQAVKLEAFKNRLVISKSTPDVGESREELPAEYTGKEMIVGFNPGYLIDVLKNLSLDNIEFEVSDAEKPGVIRMDGYVYIVLPMRLG